MVVEAAARQRAGEFERRTWLWGDDYNSDDGSIEPAVAVRGANRHANSFMIKLAS